MGSLLGGIINAATPIISGIFGGSAPQPQPIIQPPIQQQVQRTGYNDAQLNIGWLPIAIIVGLFLLFSRLPKGR